MGVLLRKRRRIQYRGQNFVWWVAPDDDDCDQIYLNIISEDKKVVLACPIGDENYTVISKGRFFQGEKTSGCWEYHKSLKNNSINKHDLDMKAHYTINIR